MSAGNYLLYRSKYWLRRQWYKIPWEWRDSIIFILMFILMAGFFVSIIYTVRKYYGTTLENSQTFQMFCIGLFSICSFIYVPDFFNKDKSIISKTISFALTSMFIMWTIMSIQNYQIKFLMGL